MFVGFADVNAVFFVVVVFLLVRSFDSNQRKTLSRIETLRMKTINCNCSPQSIHTTHQNSNASLSLSLSLSNKVHVTKLCYCILVRAVWCNELPVCPLLPLSSRPTIISHTNVHVCLFSYLIFVCISTHILY